ncbi:unnamed protein product [Didymodactylos carnosus]|uniref:Cytidyltransferase-like domain-containing protein n=1 Tax=Didymodactylos carnosus TaxID=1234261 RepID=A0A814IG36_9BILA|nr:unnamed protein product [Didymodactylos carnosus]CAF1460704.1 unnamed protein product [Didymodactylos carnosus]CAF3792633.1 unnamed protein product [Didymodactylos carnosus]CAF4254086.1 unnamed protein product [Didymodactylos carnosus]
MSLTYTKDSTNVDIVMDNIRHTQDPRRTKNENHCVLLTTGSLNPVHKSHVLSLIQAKQYLEQQYHFRVLAGYLSPTQDSYVKEKLRSNHIPSEHRIRMCEEAIKEANVQDWICVDKAECKATGFVDFPGVCIQLRRYINDIVVYSQGLVTRPIRLIYVCGLDHFNKCSDVLLLARNEYGVAVIYRPGYEENKIQTVVNPNIFYVPINDENKKSLTDVSSSLIRQKLQNGESCDSLTYKSVLEYLKLLKN